ncbi:MAG TPA: hypothetical protein VFZ59_16535 [Verrucomicrobiae bacterium]|nr:hypothetical protein [Verrucomicrobiae bacterium]
MNPTTRLLEVTDALNEAGLQFLIMGGHAVRHYGVDRNTSDFDFHVSGDSIRGLEERLRRTRLLSRSEFKEGVSWRPEDFRRYQIGVLPNGREEWLEFWIRNHLLAPFAELYQRREESLESSRRLVFLSLPDLIRSKETERDDDWSDVRLLEEILDARNLANPTGSVTALSQLRSRRGFETAEATGLFGKRDEVREAIRQAKHPVSIAYLLPFAPDAECHSLEKTIADVLRRLQPGTARHLAVVEAVRLSYQRAAKAADRADKERQQSAR